MKFLIKIFFAIAKSIGEILDLKNLIYSIMNFKKFITNEL